VDPPSRPGHDLRRSPAPPDGSVSRDHQETRAPGRGAAGELGARTARIDLDLGEARDAPEIAWPSVRQAAQDRRHLRDLRAVRRGLTTDHAGRGELQSGPREED